MNIQIIDLTDPFWLQILATLRHDIYHLPEYVKLESERTQSPAEAILIEDNEKIFFLPYLYRRCHDLFAAELTTEFFDVVSPYGYPGFLLSQAAAASPEFLIAALEQLTKVWRDRQVCSAFIRLHPLFQYDINNIKNNFFKVNGETVSIDLTLDNKDIWHQTRSEHRNKINRCKRTGFTARIVPIKQFVSDFNALYEETMERVSAAKYYLFGKEYFLKIADSLDDKIHLCIVEFNDKITCGGLFTECCGIVQYHLGGTRNEFLKQAPSKLMFDYVRFWAKERGNEVLHLGGGVGGAKDSLYHFKAGFSKQRHAFLTLRLVIDETKYSYLLELRAKSLNVEVEKLINSDFFPAYRLPNI